MQSTVISLNGVSLRLLSSGALYWAERKLLAVADLHLEKASSFARRGQLLPPYDSRATLERLLKVLGGLEVEQVICLGDSFHDRQAAERIDAQSRACLAALTKDYDWIWIAGNHDPDPLGRQEGGAGFGTGGGTGRDWGGRVLEDCAIGPLVFRHEAEPQFGSGEISGHFHPKAALRVRGRRMSCRAFLEDGARLILPAFGSLAGGLDALDPAFAPLFKKGFRAHLLGRDRIASLPSSSLS